MTVAEKIHKEVDETFIKIINEAISDACENNSSEVVVELPVTGKRTCKAIRDYFEAEGWKVTKEGIMGTLGDGDRWNPYYTGKVGSRFILTW